MEAKRSVIANGAKSINANKNQKIEFQQDLDAGKSQN